MIRKIVKINESKCNGCGLCITGCHEGALQLIDGKAKLVKDSYCDGLGACLPACPTDAITIEERESEAFDEEAVKERMSHVQKVEEVIPPIACGCPGTRARAINRNTVNNNLANKTTQVTTSTNINTNTISEQTVNSELRQWPCQIKLVNPGAPYLNNAHLLIAADCTAYAYGNIHRDFIKNRITLIGCPKLDDGDYSEKLEAILRMNEIKSLTVLRMEVPCCGGIVTSVKKALLGSGKLVPWNVVTISTDGQILEE
jgi:ferredoxin